ncbi:hypothetical protein LOOC260_107600 [Paucilactobacillus hokkaidonensis JCM 18461]|uniref:Uncharacterized protein n=2 Tax=Paucilactobacillus hokkaidonensis TaxID=1193095 RepID=A0A0A1GTH6_9LACO|nr:hypothetical protein [Paucilactobacillus hokkaidonensis]BAP85300.1 hypothetical protein LOOC260_107600 [Paucilactobacillus hokkaidonensis JCM 18461]
MITRIMCTPVDVTGSHKSITGSLLLDAFFGGRFEAKLSNLLWKMKIEILIDHCNYEDLEANDTHLYVINDNVMDNLRADHDLLFENLVTFSNEEMMSEDGIKNISTRIGEILRNRT